MKAMKTPLSPLDIEILLHCYYDCAAVSQAADRATVEAVEMFMRSGMLGRADDLSVALFLTDRGNAMVKALCETPEPATKESVRISCSSDIIGPKLLELLGVPACRVVTADIHMAAGEPVSVMIHQYADANPDADTKELVSIMKSFQLVPIPKCALCGDEGYYSGGVHDGEPCANCNPEGKL